MPAAMSRPLTCSKNERPEGATPFSKERPKGATCVLVAKTSPPSPISIIGIGRPISICSLDKETPPKSEGLTPQRGMSPTLPLRSALLNPMSPPFVPRFDCRSTSLKRDGRIIPSFGMIATCQVDGRNLFLIVKKRNTYSYVAIIRGHWTNLNLKTLFESCSKKEQLLIKTCGFQSLWKDLWVCPRCTISHKDTVRVQKKFERMRLVLSKLGPTSGYGRCLWEFPKGRKISSESDLDCALREFQEET